MGQGQKLRQSFLVVCCPAMNRRRPVAPADDRANRDHDHIDQTVLPVSFVPTIRKRFKIGPDRFDIDQLL